MAWSKKTAYGVSLSLIETIIDAESTMISPIIVSSIVVDSSK